MIYQLEIDDQDQTAKAVLVFIQQMAMTNKAIKPPVAIQEQPTPVPSPTERPFGTMRGSFKLAADFTEPLSDLNDYM